MTAEPRSALLDGLRWTGRLLLRQPRALAWILPVLWAGTIWWLSSRSAEGSSDQAQLWGFLWNFGHAPAFGLLALLLIPLAPREGSWTRLGARESGLIALLAVGYGLVDEWHQSHVPGRQASALDVLTDAVGVACVIGVVVYLSRSDAGEAGLRGRFALGLGLCALAAALSTVS